MADYYGAIDYLQVYKTESVVDFITDVGFSTSEPATGDEGVEVGSIWVDTANDLVYTITADGAELYTDTNYFSFSTSEPTGTIPLNGLWADTANEILYMWTGFEWVEYTAQKVILFEVASGEADAPAASLSIAGSIPEIDWAAHEAVPTTPSIVLAATAPTVVGYNITITPPVASIALAPLDVVLGRTATLPVGGIAIEGAVPAILIGVVVPAAQVAISSPLASVVGYNRTVTPLPASVALATPTPSVLMHTGPIITWGHIETVPVSTISLVGAPGVTAIVGGVLAVEPPAPTIGLVGAPGVTAATISIVSVEPPVPNIIVSGSGSVFVTNNSIDIDATLPMFIMDSAGHDQIEVKLPSITMSGVMASEILASISGALPEFQVSLESGEQFTTTLPSIDGELMATTVGALQTISADIAGILPSMRAKITGIKTGSNAIEIELHVFEMSADDASEISGDILRHIRGLVT